MPVLQGFPANEGARTGASAAEAAGGDSSAI